MKLWAKITEDKQIIPLNDSDYETLCKIGNNNTYHLDIVKPRNIQFHKKFFALLNLAYSNQNETKYSFTDFEYFRAYMTMKAGFKERIETDKGVFYLPKSISFSSMDDQEFKQLYDSMLMQVSKFLNTAPEDIQLEVNSFM